MNEPSEIKKMDYFSEYLNKLVNSSLPSQPEKSFVPKKNFCTKDEIIKKFLKTQNTVLETISAKSNNQHLNNLNQSSFLYHLTILKDNSHNTKQVASQEQQDPPIARPCSS